MKRYMIKAEEAFALAQIRNRNEFVKMTLNKLSDMIERQAKSGLRNLSLDYRTLVIGAENLAEAGELLILIYQGLVEAGYKNNITPNGELTISW